MLKPVPSGNAHYERDSRSVPVHAGLPDGVYVYVVDKAGTIWVLPDEHAHQHVKILGGTAPVQYAGDMEISQGMIKSVTNCSGTFQFNDHEGLNEVVKRLVGMGFLFPTDHTAVHFFFWGVD